MGERFYLQQKQGARNMSKTYTENEVKVMVKAYGEGNTDVERKEIVDQLAVSLGKTSRSIIAKLVSVGHYIKKTGRASVTNIKRKSEYVNAIRITLGARDNQLKSLENATKADLEVIMDQLKVINNMKEVSSKG
jgi:hypothetical protein